MDRKYEHLLKELPFVYEEPGSFKRSFLMDKSFLGFENISVRFGACGKPGLIVEETDKAHTHDYDQVLFFFSSDIDDVLELRAEVEIALGEEGDRFRFTVPTAVTIPKGVPHYPAVIREIDREIYFLAVSCASECKAQPVGTDKAHDAGQWGTIRSPYKMNVSSMHFMRKDGYAYGSEVSWDSGGTHAAYSGARNKPGADVIVAWQSIRKAHTMGPRTSDLKPEPHIHKPNEMLIFLGMDSDNPGYLGGECEYCNGPENEPYIINKPSVALFPKDLVHTAVTYKQPEKPYILILVFPEANLYNG